MESLQEKALRQALCNPFVDEVMLKRILERVIDFNILSESTLSRIWHSYAGYATIDKFPSKFIRNGWWYNECPDCLKHFTNCECGDDEIDILRAEHGAMYGYDSDSDGENDFIPCGECGGFPTHTPYDVEYCICDEYQHQDSVVYNLSL